MTNLSTKKLNALFIGNSYMSRQDRIIPALLRPFGYDMTARSVYAPGQSFQGHLQNNAGIVTESQKEGIERGRIGGWFSDEHCEKLYSIARSNTGYLDRALAELNYDVAFILVSGGDCENPDGLDSLESGRRLIARVREKNPGIQIVLFYPWTYLERHEELPQFEWLGKRMALENRCRLAPVGTAFLKVREQRPDLPLYRSRKDPHQNAQSILLVAYTQICTFLGDEAGELAISVNNADPVTMGQIEETASSLDADTDALFMNVARETSRQTARDLAALSPEMLKRPVIIKPDTGVNVMHADRKLLAIGNSWFDAHGAVWAELANSYRNRDEFDLHVETVTDDAATFESILANDKGELTPRQRRIMELVGGLQASMGAGKLDSDALDGFGDYPVAKALASIASRKGGLSRALALEVRWDAVLVQGFRGALDPEEDDFFGGGRMLLAKIRRAVGGAPILLMQHWAKKDASSGTQDRINSAYLRLGQEAGVPVIPVGAAFAATRAKGTELISHDYTPNSLGVQLISETLRRALCLTGITPKSIYNSAKQE